LEPAVATSLKKAAKPAAIAFAVSAVIAAASGSWLPLLAGLAASVGIAALRVAHSSD